MAPFLAAVAVFAVSVGGFVLGFAAFLIFALTMGGLIFSLSILGALSAGALAQPLRIWGRRVQSVAAVVLMLVGVTLIYSGIDPTFFDRMFMLVVGS